MIYQDENPKTVLAQLLAIKGAIDAIEKHYLCAYLSLAKEKLVKEGNETYLNDLKERNLFKIKRAPVCFLSKWEVGLLVKPSGFPLRGGLSTQAISSQGSLDKM